MESSYVADQFDTDIYTVMLALNFRLYLGYVLTVMDL